ncbi:glycosyltransferase [Gordonia paraffinivorans]|uniref:glycosyltransferase n=1 Tax=Gordonia paraffinivorans TaxID=175628 RepID=UPI0021B1D326|nr:glycosyltransferase [Gordonia paraffinivorans]
MPARPGDVMPVITDVTVVVPAHDEGDLLPACLEALTVAAAAVALPVEVIVVLDSCRDSSASVVPPRFRTLRVEERCVGAARRAGFAAASAGASPTTWFATTDADSTVPPGWLVTHVAAARDGADAYVGTITPDGFDGWPPGTGARFARNYDARTGHRHIHGANLGVRADAYAAVGGFRALSAHEDVDLVARLENAGRPIVWGAHAPVRTSTRRTGRAAEGFAAYLRGLAERTPEETG